MMPRFSERAIRNLTSIRNYIAKDSPETAARVVGAIVQAAVRLEQFPLSGRLGRIEGTRELVRSRIALHHPLSRRGRFGSNFLRHSHQPKVAEEALD
jgi:plasmid stabilization system protein ParE